MTVAPTKLTLPLPLPWLKKLGIGLAFSGPWSLLALALIERGAVGQQAVEQLIAWGPAVLILAGMYVLIERWAPKVIAGQAAATAANQKLADSVAQIADRGDRDMAEIRLMQKYCTNTLTALASAVEQIRLEVTRK